MFYSSSLRTTACYSYGALMLRVVRAARIALRVGACSLVNPLTHYRVMGTMTEWKCSSIGMSHLFK